ncbi:hypothetical protein [Pseudonocardia sp. NPDC049635]|uniref:hypothetical protein n=1 Tax=Pseudonocardia sp. NPDC049635 TaxID=3155506 RepID=UPI0033E913F7
MNDPELNGTAEGTLSGVFVVQLVPTTGDLVSAHDPRTGLIYVRNDATPLEIGHAILAAARHREQRVMPAPVIELPRPRRESDGLG